MLFGLAVHYCLEMIEEFSIEFLDNAIEVTKSRFFLDLDEEQFIDIEKRVKILLQNRDFIRLLDGAKVLREQPISFRGELKQIDLLLDYGKSLLVIDYKTSTIQDYKHYAQVKDYIEALRSITKMDVKGLVLYLLEDRVYFKYVHLN